MLLYSAQLAWTVLRALTTPKIGVLEPSRLSMRVWPTDLDTNLHMNNGRYLTLMDYGRIDMVARNGLGRAVMKNRWSPVLASAFIRFRRPLRPFQRYTLVTRIVCWDERWVVMEQRFESGDKVLAQAFVRGTFLEKGKTVPTTTLLEALGVTMPSPPMPEVVARWVSAEEAARNSAA